MFSSVSTVFSSKKLSESHNLWIVMYCVNTSEASET
jgi:hypothetical protein